MTMTRRIATGALGLAAVALAATAMRAQSPAPSTMMRSGVFPWDSVAPQPTKVGAVRHFFDNPTPTLSELELHVTTLKPGESPHPPHRHPEEELIIIREGNVESIIEGKTRPLGPGSVIFHASNELHGLRNVGTTEATYHVIKWRSAATPPAAPAP